MYKKTTETEKVKPNQLMDSPTGTSLGDTRDKLRKGFMLFFCQAEGLRVLLDQHF